MLQFTRDHGKNKKGDVVGYEIDHVDYLIRMGVLEEIDDEKPKSKPAKKPKKKK